MRSSLLSGAATMAATLTILATTLATDAEAYAQARRGAAAAAPGGTAQYWMSAETGSGLSAQAGAAGAGGRAAMLGAMTGGARNGPGYVHNLHLELGSPRRAAGTPQADHFIPSGLNAGPSLPLVSPEPAQPVTRPYMGPGGGDGGANSRILIYFGCGEHVRAGQPVEIDLGRMARGGQTPPAMAQMALQTLNAPNQSNSATFGEWPNQRSRTTIPANGSLVGAHRIVGNYSPEIDFTLAQGQDFLAPIRITQNSRGTSGAVPVAWQSVPNATGYFLMAVGSRDANTIVMWSSSEIQFNQMGAFDYLSPTEVARLSAQRVVLQPTTTQCTVPAEFNQGLQGASLMMTAFGPEANFATPRPASAPRNWRPDWTVKFRTRSQYTGLLGQDIEAMMRGDRSTSNESSPGQQQPERRRRRGLGGLGGVIGGIVGQ